MNETVAAIVIAIIGFLGGIISVKLGQKHEDKRQDKNIAHEKDMQHDKNLDGIKEEYRTEFADIKKGLEEVKASHDKSITIIEMKIESLTKAVEKHNHVIERVYKLEENDTLHTEQIKVANKRISDLERHEEAAGK